MTPTTNEPVKILITAQNSYIGNNFSNWVKDKPQFETAYFSCRDEKWVETDFSKYDVILHVAGIAHIEAKANQESLYYKVNRDLTIQLAQKAKREGVKQFIFLSSMIVFGESNRKNGNIVITRNTQPSPSGFYGDSKLQAEQGILPLHSEHFKVAIIRPPMVYGRNSKGNFPKLAALATKLPIFPKIENQRSMLYIENLCAFIQCLIDHQEHGIFHPQNEEYVNTTELVGLIARVQNKKMIFIKAFNPLVKLFSKRMDRLNKLFGTYKYSKEMSAYRKNYWVYSFKESIWLTERGQ
ncbi:NAD-dependent epimerase/dehydratase family protein [Paenibacillus sp. IB182496]|uniref:NAD-dependent epimerase/dehydratase family protein n=1 Tax=Paenibacillus sabuli TaxID=2772509 RepID=A0A927GTY0_9BACL|nr:NAD-dependent epimerase/dehydratase family protein [Paenibacillus sabuli]MBD2847560.1 NAD-dependent epimerase/dehydratase family protein [Paenibacillus sabuli]